RRCPADWTARAAPPSRSFGLDPRLFDDAAPLLDLGLDHRAEFLRRAALDLDAGAAELRAHVLLRERRVARAVQLRHDRLRRAGGREDAAPGRGVVAGQA